MTETFVEQVASPPKTSRSRIRRARVRFRQFVGFVGYAMLSFVFAVLLLESGSFVVLTVHKWFRPTLLAETSPAYKEYSWSSAYWKEEYLRWAVQRDAYEPFRIWGVAPWHGAFINADETANGVRRRTVDAASARCEKNSSMQVWTFGGSTMFGAGVPDWATIPSYLSRELNSAGLGCVVVTNFGVEAYVTNQEVQLLAEQLKAGRHPDVVVFYDGVNDSYVGGVDPGMANGHLYLFRLKARMEGRPVGRLDFLSESYALTLAKATVHFLHRGRSTETATQPVEGNSEAKALATLDNYEANLRIAKTLGDGYGFQVFCFWQPAFVHGHKPLDSYEKTVAGIRGAREAYQAQAVVYQEAERRAERDRQFVFLGSIFDSVHESLYIDRWMHLSPRGNEIVAQSLAKYVVDKLKSSAAHKSDGD
jgi:hypothetical protein